MASSSQVPSGMPVVDKEEVNVVFPPPSLAVCRFLRLELLFLSCQICNLWVCVYSFRIGSSLNSFVNMEKFSVRTEKFFLLPPLLSLVFLVWICSFVCLSDLQFAGVCTP